VAVRLGDYESQIKVFEHVERKDDGDQVKQCMLTEIEGTRTR